VAYDWAAQAGHGVGGTRYLARDAGLGAFRLAYAAEPPLSGRASSRRRLVDRARQFPSRFRARWHTGIGELSGRSRAYSS
jgi:hypothetical protein